MTVVLHRHGFGRGLVLGSVVVGLVVGCSSRPGPEPAPVVVTVLPSAAAVDPKSLLPDPDHTQIPTAAQMAELADGQVTYDEYQAGFQRMRSCMAQDGVELIVRGEINQVTQASYIDTGDASYQRCYYSEFKLVDVAWQIWRENFGADSQAMAQCLTEKGKTPGLTIKERYEALQALGMDPYKDCVNVKNSAG